MKSSINSLQYIQEDNSFNIYGTNEFADLKYSILCWPNEDGVHFGISLGVKKLLKEIKLKADPERPIFLKGHSMGASLILHLGKELESRGYTVNDVYAEAPFPIYSKNKRPIIRAKCIIIEYGNDPVTSLFPWFKYQNGFDSVNHIGPSRKWFKVLWPGNWSDHTKY